MCNMDIHVAALSDSELKELEMAVLVEKEKRKNDELSYHSKKLQSFIDELLLYVRMLVKNNIQVDVMRTNETNPDYHKKIDLTYTAMECKVEVKAREMV